MTKTMSRLLPPAVIAAGAAAGWALPLLMHQISGPTQQVSAPPAAVQTAQPAPTPIQLFGEVVAVSADSLTTRAGDGQVTTFRLTPNTTQIAEASSANGTAATQFEVNDPVMVVGNVEGGVPVATAVAHTTMGADGPPMDYSLPA